MKKLEIEEPGIIIPGAKDLRQTEGGIFLPPEHQIVMAPACEMPREFADHKIPPELARFSVHIIGASANQ